MKNNYHFRLYDELLREMLKTFGSVLIVGPKYSGKTETAKQIAKTAFYLNDPKIKNKLALILSSEPDYFFNNTSPILIDEWQLYPDIFDDIRFNIDQEKVKGKYILTGSSVLKQKMTSHSGAGRFGILKMRPLSLYESDDSDGKISLLDIKNGKNNFYTRNNLKISDYAKFICRGGWPGIVFNNENYEVAIKNYVELTIFNDAANFNNKMRNKIKIEKFIKSYARHISQLSKATTIIDDINSETNTFSKQTYDDYLDCFENLFIIENVKAWAPKLRSKTIIRTAEKKQFTDPSIAAYLLKIKPNDLLDDVETFGFLFESLCTRDLRCYADLINAEVFHYRDKNNNEVDLIIHFDDGTWGAIEVKLGIRQIDDAAKNLIKFANSIDTDKIKKPSFLMVLTTSDISYKREDGVLVVSIGSLKN